jgi:pimeloyl-ACP methyl ester carboxylesterase
VGANDGAFLGAADLMARKIAGAVKQVIPDAGHAANMDQPQLVNDAVLAFLEKVDPA